MAPLANVKWSDWAYLAVGLASTWWLTKQERGDNPAIYVLWTGVKVSRRVRLLCLNVEKSLMTAIDRELESGH